MVKYLYFRGIIVIFHTVTQKIREFISFELYISNIVKKGQLPVSFSWGLEIEMSSEKEAIWCFPNFYFTTDNATSCMKSNKFLRASMENTRKRLSQLQWTRYWMTVLEVLLKLAIFWTKVLSCTCFCIILIDFLSH